MTFQNNVFVLAADSDEKVCKSIADFLSTLHVKTAVALNPQQLVEMLSAIEPQVAIVDYYMLKDNNFSLIEIIKKEKLKTQVVVTADTADVKIAVDVIKRGAVDFLAKPFDFNEFESKIREMLKSSDQGPLPPEVLSDNEFSSLYNILKKISTTDNVETLSTVVFDSMISISGADSGVFHVYNKDKHKLVISRKFGNPDTIKTEQIFSHNVRGLIEDFSVTKKHSALLYCNNNGEVCNFSDTAEIDRTPHEISVPINIGGDRIGVISLFRNNENHGFSSSDLKMIEVVASQAGASAYHAGLYVSINRKIEELMLISNFSEQLMGMVDKYDIIRTLYSATVKYLPIDIIGFLVVQKRAHEFLYWIRNGNDSSRIESICAEVVEAYNKSYSMTINVKRVRLRSVNLPEVSVTKSGINSNPEFKHILPVAWEDFRFGAFYFESARKLENKAENTALLSNLVNQARIALTNSRLYSDIKENYIRTIKALAIAVDAKDTYTHGHSENVMNIAEEIAREMNLDEKNIGIIRDAGLLHDIGKIGIPGQILNKPGPLTYEEFNGIMKTHSSLGANIVRDVPFLQELYKLILHHHEHFDGSGYPDGIKGEQIPLGARILHVADAFEAMTSNRPYRTSLGEIEALRRLVAAKSIQFDPTVIDAFLRFAYRKYKIKL
ncbi:MAG TPA: HD domain-containing phosphohydrolase [Chitinispirillaceae bacterium]|nr:HD domain-containing phosphohydrolase [Chitinispirillaceae bacterium]